MVKSKQIKTDMQTLENKSFSHVEKVISYNVHSKLMERMPMIKEVFRAGLSVKRVLKKMRRVL